VNIVDLVAVLLLCANDCGVESPSSTVKECGFLGEDSQYVVSGSDCG
jgi:hypothetical protein